MSLLKQQSILESQSLLRIGVEECPTIRRIHIQYSETSQYVDVLSGPGHGSKLCVTDPSTSFPVRH